MSNEQSGQTQINLSAMVSVDSSRVNVNVKSWNEATDMVGNLLLKAGKITVGYVEAMKHVFKEMGPYAVIAPGIVLLHARPEDGVLKPCLGILTLSTPVPFGHSQNDPVDIVLALGAIDKNSHVIALQQLGELLSDADKLTGIRSANDVKALVKIFNGNE